MKMTVRKSWVIAAVVLIATIFAFKLISGGKSGVSKNTKKADKVAMYKIVKNTQQPLIIEASGQLKSKHAFGIYSEVTGVLKVGGKEFRTGARFRKGESMIRIDDSEVKAQLFSQRSVFQNLVISIIPDIKIEFPDEFTKWESYLNEYEIEKDIKPLPKLSSTKEKYFISGKKIFSEYYSIKNLEARYSKYNLRAPFNGVVTKTNLKPGGLVRSGQEMGVFSNMSAFELEVSLKTSEAKYINTGDEVEIFSSDHTHTWKGNVVRVNGAIDLNSQTVSVFIETKGKYLKDGMYLSVILKSKPIDHAILISRSILHNNSFVYLIKDSTLVETKINPIKYNEKTVVVDNILDGTKLVSRNISGSFPGMRVIPKEVK